MKVETKNTPAPGKWKKFLSYYKPYMGLFSADMFFACLGAAISLVIPLMIRYITNDVIYRDMDEALRVIIILAAIMVGLILLECYCNYFIAYYGHMMGAKMEFNMRNEIFVHYQKLSFSFFDNQKVGQLMSRVTNDLFEISELFHHGPEDLLISIIKLAGSVTILAVVNWKLALVAVAIIPFMVLFACRYNIKMKRAFKRNRERIAEINAQIEDNLSGIRVVKSFANEEIELEKFRGGNLRFVESKRLSYKCMGVYHAGLGAFTTFINIAVIVAGAIFITLGTIEVTDLITFLLYVNNFTEPVRKLINFTEQFQNGATGYERFLEMVSVVPEIKDAPDAAELKDVEGNVSFQNVSFHYENNENVLNNISFDVAKGEYIAFVGSSGVGKTTLCSLIPRFYDVSAGSILIDGKDIRSVTQKSLRDNIGIVQQDVYLFGGSVTENIRYGKPSATDEEIVAAAKWAGAHEFITQLPNGYDTDIGQRGVKLSGGQKQRISIARVFLKNPPILIFDEATSALDNETERVVQESLEKLAHGRTTFVIAHRLSTVRNADRFYVLTDDGIEIETSYEKLVREGM
ncbi:MAG: ABC transporter ATP-binding protein [Oscillospiraceae bacterium]|nr:ABC transporter ATP-binding protein [Oscillospiraceae bacterium]